MSIETEPLTMEFRTNSSGVHDLGETLRAMLRHELAEHRIGDEPDQVDLKRVEIQATEGGVFDVYAEAGLQLPE